MILLAFLILSLPTVVELIAECNGEAPEHKRKSTAVRATLMVICAAVATTIIQPDFNLWPLTYLKCLSMSFAIFFLTFDYAITTILIHRCIIETKEIAFSYVGKTSKFDKFRLWVRIGPWGRFAVKLAVFVVALIIYF